MEPFDDIDSLFNKELNEHTLPPSDYCWLTLFEKLGRKERLKKRKVWCTKVAAFAMVLLFVLPFMIYREDTVGPSNVVEKHEDRMRAKKTHEPINKKSEVANNPMMNEGIFLLANTKKTKAKVPATIEPSLRHPSIKVEPSPTIGLLAINAENNFSSESAGTLFETDTLKLTVQNAEEFERVKLAARRTRALHLLNEIESGGKRTFGATIKNGYNKVKAIIAN